MKKTLRFRFALLIGKAAYRTGKLLKMNASHFPGRLAINLCPDFLGRIDKPEKIVCVTGTNGKTTACNMILDVLSDCGYDVLNNRAGSNLNAGIATSLLSHSTLGGKVKHKLALFEVDERSSKLIYPFIHPDFAVCTNLFRDSLQRNAHTEYIFNLISNHIPKDTHMILNADDAISSGLAPDNERTYYSIAHMESDHDADINIINDARICPKCYHLLQYNYLKYHHIGNAYCPNCGFTSPESDYAALPDFDARTITVKHGESDETYPLITDSMFNTYNQVTAIAVLRELGLSPEEICSSFEKVKVLETRYSSKEAKGVEVITHLSKGFNPIACSCVFEFVSKQPGEKEVILMLGDIYGHSHSPEIVTWMYDADFEYLNQPDINHLIVCGERCEDYKLRLLLAGVSEDKITCVPDEAKAHEYLRLDKTEKVFILHQVYATNAAAVAQNKIIDRLNQGGMGYDQQHNN